VEEPLKGISEAKERKKEVGKKAKEEEATEKVLQVLEALPDGETQTEIAKLVGLQPRVVGPALAGLVGQKRAVPAQVRKPSGKGETWYPAWRLATNNEFLEAKMKEMGIEPAVEAEKAPEAAGKRPGRARGVQVLEHAERRPARARGIPEAEDDTDWLDEVEAGSVGK
jgi:alkylated DNA nucleotide flippase Atl1